MHSNTVRLSDQSNTYLLSDYYVGPGGWDRERILRLTLNSQTTLKSEIDRTEGKNHLIRLRWFWALYKSFHNIVRGPGIINSSHHFQMGQFSKGEAKFSSQGHRAIWMQTPDRNCEQPSPGFVLNCSGMVVGVGGWEEAVLGLGWNC